MGKAMCSAFYKITVILIKQIKMSNKKILQETDKALHIGSVTNRTFECVKCGGKYELLAGYLPKYCSAEVEGEENETCGGTLIETTI